MGNTVQKTEKTCAEIFELLDVDNSKTLDVEELKHLVIHLDYNLHDLLQAGENNPGEITFQEFRDYFVTGVENKTCDLNSLKTTIKKLKDTKELMRSVDAHKREGIEDNRLASTEANLPVTSGSPVEGKDPTKCGPEATSRMGKIMKGSGGRKSVMQERYLVLGHEFLHYFKRGTVRPMGEVPLKYVSEVTQKEDKFMVIVGKRTFEFKAENSEDAKDWVTAIKGNIALVKSELLKIPSGKFWKVEPCPPTKPDKLPVIEFKRVLKELNTGDLLLFQTKGIGPALVRSATSSQYDHVGMFVRRGGRLGILESLGEPGVIVSGFNAFYEQGWFQQYTALIVRKLTPPLGPKKLKDIKRFCRGVEGKKYSLTPAKLMRRQSTVSFDAKDRTYFCSELVAKALKHLGLLRGDCASTEYIPGSFAACEKLVLLNGAAYSEEFRVDFPPLKKLFSKR